MADARRTRTLIITNRVRVKGAGTAHVMMSALQQGVFLQQAIPALPDPLGTDLPPLPALPELDELPRQLAPPQSEPIREPMSIPTPSRNGVRR